MSKYIARLNFFDIPTFDFFQSVFHHHFPSGSRKKGEKPAPRTKGECRVISPAGSPYAARLVIPARLCVLISVPLPYWLLLPAVSGPGGAGNKAVPLPGSARRLVSLSIRLAHSGSASMDSNHFSRRTRCPFSPGVLIIF